MLVVSLCFAGEGKSLPKAVVESVPAALGHCRIRIFPSSGVGGFLGHLAMVSRVQLSHTIEHHQAWACIVPWDTGNSSHTFCLATAIAKHWQRVGVGKGLLCLIFI